MPPQYWPKPSAWLAAFLFLLLSTVPPDVAWAQSAPPYVFSGPMLPLLVQMPENGWLRVNTNLYSDVWTPPELEPLDNGATHPPSKIILPWSSFAWDSNRGDLILYGGGHANYSGNDVYRWHSATLMWERAALPSEIFFDPVAGFLAIDGVDNAPTSAHTYKNNMFLPIVDRFLTWGGAVYGNGGAYARVSESDPTQARLTGPYLFDPSRADGNKVGGTTGSHVMRVSPHPEIVGGQMWANRDIPLHLAGEPMPSSYGSGCASYSAEAGLDVVYVGGTRNESTALELFRYQLTDIANPALDQIEQVGAFAVGTSHIITCGYDPSRQLFVKTGDNVTPFSFWDLTMGGPENLDQRVDVESTIASLQSWLALQNFEIQNCAIEFDPVRRTFPLWCGDGAIWELHEPPSGNTTAGWTVTQRPAPQTATPPGESTGTGVLGKWRYAPFYDVFVGLEDINNGEIWIYKPVGWVEPNPTGNLLPTVAITSPANGLFIFPGTPISLTAAASDPDGSIARVEFYVNGEKLGQATSPPYTIGMTPLFVGTYNVTVVAVDNVGGMTAAAPVAFTVFAQLTTVTLQRGLNGYAGATDTYLDSTNPTTSWGASPLLFLDVANDTPLIRFAIFQSEGGPVPDGLVVQSATLSLYKQYYDDALRLNALLKPWVEGEATWTNSQIGTTWNTSGAAGAGTDYDSTVDALVTGSFDPGWIAFDVTPRVQQWSNVPALNNGWRMAQVSDDGINFKQFYSSEYLTDSTLRPKLTVVYANARTTSTTTVMSSQNPSTFGSNVMFTATVTANLPTGNVAFTADGSAIAGCEASALIGVGDSRTAQCSDSGLSVATHGIIAIYGGDTGNNGSTSAPLLQIVNPASPPSTVTGVVSRKTHGAAGVFDLPLSMVSTEPTTEPRLGPAQTLVFQFDKPVVSGTAAVTEGTAVAGTVTFAGNEMIVNLTDVNNEQYVTVTLSNVMAADGVTGGSGSVRVGFLAGDVNQSRVVSLSDLVLVNAALAQVTTASNYLKDVNATGAISLADLVIVNTNLTKALPAP